MEQENMGILRTGLRASYSAPILHCARCGIFRVFTRVVTRGGDYYSCRACGYRIYPARNTIQTRLNVPRGP